ncbi:hypothetical protein KP78_27640 [Jeotgalibacillus soli]|uniref:Uncharacterized protein n=1 Tax=Jeotgalibacillus soli TaxID=889306 RepID=A0A0C2VL82_9BACL|nr:hypothetical protein KP78_27640 [Jeotgalibacillus soli]
MKVLISIRALRRVFSITIPFFIRMNGSPSISLRVFFDFKEINSVKIVSNAHPVSAAIPFRILECGFTTRCEAIEPIVMADTKLIKLISLISFRPIILVNNKRIKYDKRTLTINSKRSISNSPFYFILEQKKKKYSAMIK